MILREYIRTMLEMVTQADKIERLQPDDTLLVYHGTGGAYLPMIHGIDATQEHHRSYGGQRHEGLFVSTDPETALRFASSGQVVFEIETKAKALYGTDYSGNTAKKQIERGMPDPNELWQDKYPESFRPYLSTTLLQASEPQALLVGVVRPDHIKRVQWKGTWYDREELLDMMPEYHKPYERTPTKLERMPFDPTDGSISLDEFYEAVTNHIGGGHRKAEDTKRMFDLWTQRNPEELWQHIEDIGWRRGAAKELAQKIIEKHQ